MGHVKHLHEVEGDSSKEWPPSRERSILSVNEEGHNCLDISNISSHLKVNKLLDQDFSIVDSIV